MSLMRKNLHGRYDKVASKITGMVDELNAVVDDCACQSSNIESRIVELEAAKADVETVGNKAAKLRSNLNKLFE